MQMIYRNIATILLLAILAAGVPGNATAQSHEKKHGKKHARRHRYEATETMPEEAPISRKELRKKERMERKKLRRERRQRHFTGEPEYIQRPTVKKKKANLYPETKMKSMYRVEVLMPMYLDELVKGGQVSFRGKIPDKALPGISFYEGISIAADSLKKAGFNIDIYIHDIATPSESPEALVSGGKLDSADLIIGAVLSKDIPVLAEFANQKHINFVSALSASDAGVSGNPYFTLVQPSLKTHCEWIVDDAARKFPGQKVLVLYRKSNEADENAYRYVTKYEGAGKVTIKKLDCNSIPSRESLLKYIDTTKPNIVIVPVLDNGYSDSILKTLSGEFPYTHFEIYGMPSWNSIASLNKKNAFPNLSVNVTSPFNFDLSSVSGKYVASAYRKDYGGKPADLVYRGYETLFWYANLLKQYGTIFNDKYPDNTSAPFTKFEVKPQVDKDGKIRYDENMHVFLSTYEGGSYKTQ
jgi:hypothetical protein